ncbi:MAG: ferrous iron transport protein A [Hydrogenophilaceae bacterium]|nr:ferrous iron transport protein A [Hydrogenophilaceae bacterium]
MNTPATVSLDQLPAGAKAVVRQLRGGRELVNRLAAMGLTEGARLAVLQNTGRGPMLVSVRDTRIALGRGEAIKILVEAVAA